MENAPPQGAPIEWGETNDHKETGCINLEVGGDGWRVRKGLAEKAASRRLETAMCIQATGRWFRGYGQGYQL